MADRDLKLNSLRFTKTSPRLVLEEHGHCEVPAGCGGVVLRWRRRAEIPVTLWIHVTGAHEVFLDGVALSSARPLVEAGDHVLAIRVAEFDARGGVLLFACVEDSKDAAAFTFVSLADARWRYSTTTPMDGGWMKAGFDDRQWPAMIAKKMPRLDDNDPHRFRIERVAKLGATPIGIDRGGSAGVWIRRPFTIAQRQVE